MTTTFVDEQATALGESTLAVETFDGMVEILLIILRIATNHNETCVSDEGE